MGKRHLAPKIILVEFMSFGFTGHVSVNTPILSMIRNIFSKGNITFYVEKKSVKNSNSVMSFLKNNSSLLTAFHKKCIVDHPSFLLCLAL
ncbi:MAG: hypothetical protein Ta2B_26490 [Termitinemataceae bacterium]|nr:MAG: hypothetical protein Ta2B_26490 [Termitinemataceae bacterium]